MYEFEVENIDEVETLECIKVFDEELNILLNKTPECSSVEIEKYSKAVNNEPVEIHMEFTRQGKKAFLAFKPDFFEDYCYSTRKERNLVLKNTLEEIKDKIATL